jgi:hypothetical protein
MVLRTTPSRRARRIGCHRTRRRVPAVDGPVWGTVALGTVAAVHPGGLGLRPVQLRGVRPPRCHRGALLIERFIGIAPPPARRRLDLPGVRRFGVVRSAHRRWHRRRRVTSGTLAFVVSVIERWVAQPAMRAWCASLDINPASVVMCQPFRRDGDEVTVLDLLDLSVPASLREARPIRRLVTSWPPRDTWPRLVADAVRNAGQWDPPPDPV